MIEKDTIKLLRECDAGVKMGMSAIDDVMEHVKSERLRSRLLESRSENEAINSDIQSLLTEYHDEGKEPPAIAKSMAWLKTKTIKRTLRSISKTLSSKMVNISTPSKPKPKLGSTRSLPPNSF